MFHLGLVVLLWLGVPACEGGFGVGGFGLCLKPKDICYEGIQYCANGGVCYAGDASEGGCVRCCCQPGFHGHRCGLPDVNGTESSASNCTLNVTTPMPPVDSEVVRDSPTDNFTCGAHVQPLCSQNGECNSLGVFVCSEGASDYTSGCCHRCATNNCTNGYCMPVKQDNGVFLPRCHCYYDYELVNNTCVHKCVLHPNITDCLQDPPQELDHTDMYIAIGSSVGVLFLLLLLFVILLCFFHKRKYRWALKFIYKLSRYEDNDSLKYDVFLSYKARDTADDFVLRQLFPRLESEWGYDVCIHERDFVPGKAIAENIAETMSQSRRVVLVLTNEFVTSEWCRYEYMAAQQLMLKRKTRIIPVMFEDITQHPDMDDNLRYILDHVTYLEVPAEESRNRDNFWQRLRYALPKTHAADQRSGEGGGCCCRRGLKGHDALEIGGEVQEASDISLADDAIEIEMLDIDKAFIQDETSLNDSGCASELDVVVRDSTHM